MSKPWDLLREQAKRPPIGCGSWPSSSGAIVYAEGFSASGKVALGISVHGMKPSSAWFSSQCLRQLAEFCTELADQLDGK